MFGIWGKQATDLSGVCAWGVAKSASFVCVVQFTGKDVLAQYCQLLVVFYFFIFLAQEASVLIQRCQLGTLGRGLGKSFTPQRDCAGWHLGAYL